MTKAKPTPPKSQQAKAKSLEPSFEQALAQVEAIIEQIESGEMGLEDQIEQYAKGAELLDRCRAVLNRCEQRVEEISAQFERRDHQQGDKSGA